ncbi:RNA polymerase II elongation factor ELL-like isoform X1 [Acipenser ruthenus]|uniref:RNA polymerase II elongation factor ELL-like isoform X1 n=1 Tax=Acipenser ruthenus TaxID=7906 RepID=UPI002741E682|nr:RNA polymerase II elongation factor ELL-like isoform X1 [Acipenser ruthenus]
MAALREEHRYGLSCGKINKITPNKTLYHVKLTDTAIRALEAYQNLKGSLPNQPVICFKGNQGYIKIPAPSSDSPGALRLFSFYLSSDSKDKPQASFDCIHQYVTGLGREQLESQGSIQDKITVCATDDSYQMTRERMSQVEKETWSRAAIEIKPGSTYRSKCFKVQKRHGPAPVSDSFPFRKHSPPNPTLAVKRSSTSSIVLQRPLRDRIIHLLALKPYRKPELILWLEREKANPKDKADLALVLDAVAKVNSKENSYTLKDEYYRHVQKDWPGYTEEEKQLLHRLLMRKLQPTNINQPRSFQSKQPFHKSSGDSPSHFSPIKNPAVKRPVPSEPSESLANKKQKVLDQNLHQQPIPNGLRTPPAAHSTTATVNSSLHVRTEFQRTSNVSESQNGFLPQHSYGDSSVTNKPGQEFRDLKPAQLNSLRTEYSLKEDEQLSGSQHKKKKSKKHKEKERERLKEEGGENAWPERSPDLKHNQENLKECTNTPITPTTTAGIPDYLLKYNTITTPEQRQNYKEDFCDEYDEYRDLHARIGSVTEQFVQLGSKIKTLSPGTQEYKVIEDQIFGEYRKYKKKCPGYREEKKRCRYLHQKLSHIKSLILDYDKKHMPL